MKFVLLAAVAATVFAAPAVAQITPGNQTINNLNSPVPVGTSWGLLPGEQSGGGTATITTQNVTDTDGSLNITGDRSRVQTGVQYAPFTTNSGVSANSIVDLTADFFTNSLGTNASASPALRVLLQDGSVRSELVWEGANNNDIGLGAGSADASDLFYQTIAGVAQLNGQGGYVFNTLLGWGNLYSGSAFVSGLSIGAGSGFGAGFSANVDNLAFTTDAGTTRYNFASASVAAVPEPATWAMMLMGFGAMGISLRRRRRTNTLFQAA